MGDVEKGGQGQTYFKSKRAEKRFLKGSKTDGWRKMRS